MFNRFEWIVAGRYLRARRGERFVSIIALFSLIGIALGVATLIIVMAVMNGFRADLMARVLGLNGDLTIFRSGQIIEHYEQDVKTLRAIDSVVQVTPMAEGTVLISAGRYATGGVLRGISPKSFRELHALSDTVVAGDIKTFSGEDSVAIGTTLAARAALSVGDKLTLLSPSGRTTPIGVVPRVKSYHVAIIFDAGVNDYDSSVVLMPLAAAQRFLMMPGAVSLIQVATNDSLHVQRVTRVITKALADPDLRVIDWTQSNNAFLGALTVQQNVMFLILTLIILVAAFNTVSSMIMMVKDKTRDIAVLRTLGASRAAIMRIFFICGASIGVLGTFIGFSLGVVFCLNIKRIQHAVERATHTNLFNPEFYYLEHLPAKLVWFQVGEVVVMSLALSFIATLYPSWRAAKTDPCEALRHE